MRVWCTNWVPCSLWLWAAPISKAYTSGNKLADLSYRVATLSRLIECCIHKSIAANELLKCWFAGID